MSFSAYLHYTYVYMCGMCPNRKTYIVLPQLINNIVAHISNTLQVVMAMPIVSFCVLCISAVAVQFCSDWYKYVFSVFGRALGYPGVEP